MTKRQFNRMNWKKNHDYDTFDFLFKIEIQTKVHWHNVVVNVKYKIKETKQWNILAKYNKIESICQAKKWIKERFNPHNDLLLCIYMHHKTQITKPIHAHLNIPENQNQMKNNKWQLIILFYRLFCKIM